MGGLRGALLPPKEGTRSRRAGCTCARPLKLTVMRPPPGAARP
jgi:hypothetical protein